jgi:hypothetical protein
MKITLAVASSGVFKTDTVKTLVGTVQTSKYPIEFLVAQSSMVHHARKRLVESAQKNGSSHIFFVDSDMAFEDDVLPRLLAHDKDIVGANYHFRFFPIRTNMKLNGEVKKGLNECEAIGTGCLLIKMSVFDVIDKPWFWYEDLNEKECMTEDYWFCRQARRKGLKVWYDGDLNVKHLGDYGY